MYLCTLWESVRKFKRSAGTDSGVTPLSYFPKYCKIPVYKLEPDTKSLTSSFPDADIPKEARTKLQELLDMKYLQIISQTATDIGRTKLTELDIPTEGPSIASKPYMIRLKYREFVDNEIKQLEEAGIILQSMSDWAQPHLGSV